MKKLYYLILLFSTINIIDITVAQQVDTNLIELHGNTYFHISNNSNNKLIIYLHGGVRNPYFKEHENEIDVNYLMENNKLFVAQSLKNGYDLLLPITNEKLNWIKDYVYCLQTIKDYIDQHSKKYNEHYISGFSDGGTGSYKMFYSDPAYFDGLIVFNGNPMHKWYAKTVNYEIVKDKKVIFIGTKNDKVMHYEFMLTEYCKQKLTNSNTYIYLTEGEHSFSYYQQKDIDVVFDILNTLEDNTQNKPIHAYIRKDTVVEFYKYRRSIYRKYGHGLDYYKINKKQQAQYN